jgi:hypothetical protein
MRLSMANGVKMLGNVKVHHAAKIGPKSCIGELQRYTHLDLYSQGGCVLLY